MYYTFPPARYSGHGTLLMLLVAGPIVLLRGLRKLSEKRLIQNTPVSKVRSAAMGLVELQGMARQNTSLKAPLSNFDACWWNCRVEEYRQEGKDSHWALIKQVGTSELFYLEDSTGRVLVSPQSAEFHAQKATFDLSSMTRTLIAPVLNSWGLDDMTWFGGERRIRIIEEAIPEGWPLFVMGELVTVGNDPMERKERFNARLRAIKADPAKMAEADVNHDGTVDAEEWAAFEAKQEEEFTKEEMSRQAQMPNELNMVVKAPAHSPYVISTKDEQELVNSFKWLAPLGIFGGMALTGLGVWAAVGADWNPMYIAGALVTGCLLGIFGKNLTYKIERSSL